MAAVNQIERAFRAWPILAEVAANKGTITYLELGQHLGIHHRPVRYILAEIQDYCLSENLPPITILVVRQSGRPGTGFIAWDEDDLDSGMSLVYQYPWTTLENPFGFASDGATPESIADEVIQDKITPREAYSRVRVRGMAQRVFREVLLRAYGARCAISNIASLQLLEAAHIIPWTTATHDQRISPRNGILFSILHHKFFDLRWIRIQEDYRVVTDFSGTRPNTPERKLLEAINGTKLRLPDDRRHWPDPEFIRKRNLKSIKPVQRTANRRR